MADNGACLHLAEVAAQVAAGAVTDQDDATRLCLYNVSHMPHS